MILVRFRNSGEHADILKKVKKMKKFAEELEDCLEDVMDEEDVDYRHKDYDEEDIYARRGMGGRYANRGGRSRM